MAECENCGTTEFPKWEDIRASKRLAWACEKNQLTDDLAKPGEPLPVLCGDCTEVLGIRTWSLCDIDHLEHVPWAIAIKVSDFHDSFKLSTPKKRTTTRLDRSTEPKRQRIDDKTPPHTVAGPPQAPWHRSSEVALSMLDRDDDSVAKNLSLSQLSSSDDDA